MYITVRNVNEALFAMINNFREFPERLIKTSPRGMATLEWSGPVITEQIFPEERVLFCAKRNANPFLHFFGALWMLAGRNDLKFLTTFAKRFTEFSDDQKTLHGAYGHRWRKAFDRDQLQDVIALLKREPNSRRAVLSMWDPRRDLESSKDIPCNTSLYLKVREGRLNMTVNCRSNDMLWGAYGTDSVDFSTLQEYIADKLMLPVGSLIQLSDSFHVYVAPHPSGELWDRVKEVRLLQDPYANHQVVTSMLSAQSDEWDKDLVDFFIIFDNGDLRLVDDQVASIFRTGFFINVVMPMWRAFECRNDAEAALHFLRSDVNRDWIVAAREWIMRRFIAKNMKEAK